MVLIQFTKEQVKEEVKKLVDKYNRIVESGSIKGYSENGTKKDFITPLFKALGWDVENEYSDDEVKNEEKISKGRVDYSFRINGIPKFFLEAKALKEDLDNIKFVEQAINYAWHKGCTWAVLTDFEAIKIFNAEWKSTNPLQAQFGQTLPCQLFLEKFDQLWLLSRESFEKKLLDTEAEKWGKKVKKISVDKQLLDDLTKFRNLLNKNILKNNSSKNMSADDLDEAVQRIIDRLIFIRTLEDKELEAPMLQSAIREDLNKRVYKKLNLIFRKIDDIYNSKLFTPHLCENLEIDDEVLSKIINGLFNTSDNTVHYDFSAIDADVLGNIYEQYLGHILKKTDKRAKLAEGKAHRKEQGIYYTPTYVVDYIVKNTVGELAKDKNFDLKNIKILDPACGSGSFLMKAFDYLVTLDKKRNVEIEQVKLDLIGESATYGRKMEILKNNIFGVDLDPKAVEIAQLNLLLKAAEKKHRLPTLQENIKIGNSLIDDKNISPRAFKWEEEFKEIIDNGGFDVVIGNPPYVTKELSEKDRVFFSEHYMIGSSNLYKIFIEKSISLIKEGGYFGFIIPNSYLSDNSSIKLRELLLKNTSLQIIIYFSERVQVFNGVIQALTILIFKKVKKFSEINILEIQDKKKIVDLCTKHVKFEKINQKQYLELESYGYPFLLSKERLNIVKKLNEQPHKLQDFVLIYREVNDKLYQFIKNEKGTNNYPLVRGKDISNWQITLPEKKQDESWFDKSCLKKDRSNTERLVIQHVSNQAQIKRLKVALLPPNIYCHDSTYAISIKDQTKIHFILGMLNSKLINYYFKSLSSTNNITTPEINNIPLPNLNTIQTDKLNRLAKSRHSLTKLLIELKDKQTDEKAQLEKEIQKLDNEIDEEVYKLYGITEEEKKIIEESLK